MSRASHRRGDEPYREWTGGYRPYDILREATIALGVVLALAVLLTILFSSPDDPPSKIKQWSRADAVDFVTTPSTELDGSSTIGGYGPPYNRNADGQHIGFLHLAKWLGVSHPIDSAGFRARAPALADQPAELAAGCLDVRGRTNPDSDRMDECLRERAGQGLGQPTRLDHRKPGQLRAGTDNDGVAAHLRPVRRSGRCAVDQPAVLPDRLHQATPVHGRRRRADKPGAAAATARDAVGNDERDRQLPGQAWLWLYTFWYQIKPFSTSANADLLVKGVMGVMSLAFILLPFLPGVRGLPRRIPVYKLIWRDHYRSLEPPSGAPDEPQNTRPVPA